METRRSARLPKYDYGKQGVYFVTLCTYQRQCTLSTVGRDKVNCPKGKRRCPGVRPRRTVCKFIGNIYPVVGHSVLPRCG